MTIDTSDTSCRRRSVTRDSIARAFLWAVLLAAAALAGCGGSDPDAGRAGGAPARGAGTRGRRPGPATPVAVATAQRGSIASYYTATASLAPEKQAEVLARVAGVVESIDREEGDWVAKSGALLSIDDTEYRYNLEKARAKTADLRSRFERVENMVGRNLVSAEEFDKARADLRTAEADEGLAELTLSYASVTAAFAGRVVSRLVDVGQTVGVGTPLFVVSDFDPLLAKVHVPARAFRRLLIDQPVDLMLESDGRSLRGRIKLVSPVIDPSSGTIKVTVEIHDVPRDVRPGDFAAVRIVTDRHDDAMLVPKNAVVTDHGESVVFVAADSTAERRVVEVGFEDDRNAEIIDGVGVGDPVVVKGQRSLKHGVPIRVLDGTSRAAKSRRRKGD